jgi:two-component system, cell cycle sensor histidine kinase and response regulator CckA
LLFIRHLLELPIIAHAGKKTLKWVPDCRLEFLNSLFGKDFFNTLLKQTFPTIPSSLKLRFIASLMNTTLHSENLEIPMSLEKIFQDTHDVINKAPIGIFTSTPDGRYISSNPALARMYGYDSPEELMQSVTDITAQVYVNPEDRIGFIRIMKERGEVVNYESRRFRRDGTIFWVSINGRAVRDEDGQVLAYQGFTTDITEHKHAEMEAQRQGDLIVSLLDTVSDVIFIKDIHGVYLGCNTEFAQHLGRRKEDIPGKTDYDLYSKETADFFRDNDRRMLELGKPRHNEEWISYPDGRKILLETLKTPYRDADGNIIGVIGICRDITQRKLAEEKLRLQSLVLDQIEDRVTVTDLSGKITYVNQAEIKMLGFSREEILTQSTELYGEDPERGATQQEILEKTLQKGSWRGEVVNYTKDGSERIMDFRTLVVHDQKGQPVALCGISTDITERKQAEKEREKLQTQLLQAQKMESIGILAGGIAHDFNNLLHAMGGNLELLDIKIPDDHPGKKRVKTIQKSMDKAAHLVRQMLLFSRKADIRTQVLDLNQEIHDAAKLLERSIPRMISIELVLDKNAWPINADPTQVDQVLLNLGTNAADAMPDGGILVIETANAALGQNLERTPIWAKQGKYVLMTVSDTGCGMDKKTRDQVFDPFFTTKEVGKGTGLGLPSVYGIVKAHEGYVTCYSEPGQGTAFKIYWPAAEPGKIEPGEIQTEQAVLQDGTETILLVDDDDQIRELTSEVLEDSGYQVISASSGEQALEIFRKKAKDIDLVLMDLNMPGMGGSRCTRKMITLDPSVRVLVASGYSAIVHGRDVLEFGAKDFISKPYQKRELLTKITEVLGGE